MNITNVITVVTTVLSILSFLYTFLLYYSQLEEIKNQRLPNLKIISITSSKSNLMNPSVYDGKYCRISTSDDKHSTVNMSLDGRMAVFKTYDEQIEDGFIEEIKSHIGDGTKNDAYFTYFGSNPYLIITHASSQENFLIDHANVRINFHNYGAIISAISIESFTVYYKSNEKMEPLTFYGNRNSKITLSPKENDNFVLFFDEVTTNLQNSLCEVDPSDYDAVPETLELLRSHMVENKLRYDKLELTLRCWDLYNNETISKITVEYNGNFFISSTTVSKEKWFKKLFRKQ